MSRYSPTVLLTLLLMLLTLPSGLCAQTENGKTPQIIRIALIHLDSRPGEVEHNRRQIETAIGEAIANKADWIITPELAETGYRFTERIGTEWIETFPGRWVRQLASLAAKERVALLVGIAEKDALSGKLFNSIVVIDRGGVIQGTYRKHRVVNGPAERWAEKGTENSLFMLGGVPVGLLICADAYKPEQAVRYGAMGARILLSPANWPPHGTMGPKGYWEAVTRSAGLPLLVNNRTGKETELDFSDGESVVVQGGQKLFSFKSPRTTVFYLDWHVARNSFSAANAVKADR